MTATTPSRHTLFARWKGPATHFVETGTQAGDGIAAALAAGFPAENIVSHEISQPTGLRARDRFPGVRIRIGPSAQALKLTIQEIFRHPTMFWLDAHRMDGRGSGVDDYPLHEEVRIIAQNWRLDVPCVLLCDDRRLFPRFEVTDNDIWGQLALVLEKNCKAFTDTVRRHLPGDVLVCAPPGWSIPDDAKQIMELGETVGRPA